MEPPSTVTVHVFNPTSDSVDTDVVADVVSRACALIPGIAHGSIEVLLADDVEIRRLNAALRGIDEATDVLTFPAPTFPNAPLGEIAVSLPFARRQALERGIAFEDEVAYLLIHGCLHLAGQDDDTVADREQMFAEMHRIGQALGLPEQREWHSLHSQELAT